MVARVMQRVSLAAFYREDFGEAQERGLEAARMHERLDSFRTAALAYSVLYVIAYSSAADLDMARFYAERVSLNAKRGGDESMQNYGLVLQLHIAAESGDRRRLGSIRARLMANPMHEQYRERLAFIISEALLAGWSERFDSATAALVSLQDGEVRIRGDRALCTALLSLAAAANWKLDEARRLARRAISESVQQRGHEAKFETRARVIARFLASATCYLVGDASRGQRALSAAFDPQGIFRASLSANGVDPAQIPPLMRGYALYVNAAFASARRFVPVHGLTQVENEVLRVLPTGVTIARIAADRGKSRKTIERQVESIYAKFGVRNRIEAINKARELGILK
jgi:DNA-binding CsgD family transcriptional regulator